MRCEKRKTVRNVSPWLVRRSPENHRFFEVVSFNEWDDDDDVVVAKKFKNLEKAQEFAREANLMIGRSGACVRNI